jgi:hypothetical protein
VHRHEAHLQRALTTAMQQLAGIRGGAIGTRCSISP